MLYIAVLLPFIMHVIPYKNKKLLLGISIIPALYIILFRFSLGTDYFSYEFIFHQHNVRSLSAALNSQTKLMEIGFRLLIYIFRSLNLSYHVFAATISLITYTFFIKWILDNEVESFLQITLLNGMFFVVWALSGLRQGLVLALGSYLFFSKKEKLNIWQSIIAIFVLAQFHVSAYIYLPLLLIKKVDLKRSHLSLILAFSLVFTIIPYHRLLLPFESIDIVRRFLKYLVGSQGFWDFSGLIRLGFAIFILVFYNTFKKDQYIKFLADTSIIGFSLYFFLKTSEVVASRLNIYTFVLIIPLLVYLLVNKFNTKYLNILAIFALLGFSMLYLEKDLINHQKEVGALEVQKVYKLKTIFNTDLISYLDYDNVYPFLTYQQKFCEINKQVQINPKNDHSNEFYVVKDKASSLYGVINGEGDWQIKPTFTKAPTLLNDIIEVKIDDKITYFDLSNQEVNNDEEKIIQSKKDAQAIKDESPKRIEVNYDDMSEQLDKFFPSKDSVEEVLILEYNLPFKHKLLRVRYVDRFSFFILDDNLNIVNDMLYKKAIRFGLNDMAYGNTYCGYVALNSSGDIVWIND